MAKQKEITEALIISEPKGLMVPDSFQIGDHKINVATLEQRLAEDTKHTITNLTDTAGYKQAVILRGVYRTTRTTVAKVVKEMAQPHKDYVTALKKASEEIGAIAYKGEEYFDSLITAIDEEKERIKQQAIIDEQNRIQGRINQLRDYDAVYSDGVYDFGYTDLAITTVSIKEFGDGDWSDFMIELEFAYATEKSRQAKLKEEQEAEATRQRLQLEQDENDRFERQAELDRQAEANKDKRSKLRTKEIKLMGFLFTDEVYEKEGYPFQITQYAIEDSAEHVWDGLISEIENYTAPVEEVEPIAPETPLLNHDELMKVLEITEEPEPVPYNEVNVEMIFTSDMPFTNLLINKNTVMRVYPSEYQVLALEGLKTISSGELQELHWVTFKNIN